MFVPSRCRRRARGTGRQRRAGSHRRRVYAASVRAGNSGRHARPAAKWPDVSGARRHGVRVGPVHPVMSTTGTLPGLLEELAACHGGREALISTRSRLSFADLAALADRLAGALAARGVGRGTHVALLLLYWPEWLAIAFAVWRCGGVLVPLNTLYRPRELGHALSLGAVSVLIAARGFLRHDYVAGLDRKSTRLNSSHLGISYAV